MAIGRVVLVALAGLLACGTPEPDARPNGGAEEAADMGSAGESAAPQSPVRPVVGPDSVPRYRYTPLDSAEVDVDGDGVRERLELAATVELGPDGRPLWEDGHHWLVRLRHGERTYLLLQEFVPWGDAAVWTVRDQDGSAILVQVRSAFGDHVGTRLDRWVHDPAAGGWARVERAGGSGAGVHLAAPR